MQDSPSVSKVFAACPAAPFSSRPRCRTPTVRSTSATSWSTSRPTSGCAFSACSRTRSSTSSAPTTRMAPRSCSGPKRKALRRRNWSPGSRRRDRSSCSGFHLSFDHWGSTDSPTNFALSHDIYRKLDGAGLIYTKSVEQFFDPVKEMFLPDRYIRGECPKCGAKDQYGDACENCSTLNAPTDLIRPYSTVSGATPVREGVRPFLFPALRSEMRRRSCRSGRDRMRRVASGCSRKSSTRHRNGSAPNGKGLGDWDISRDAPYFGIPIPECAGQVLLRLAGRAGRLSRQPEGIRRQGRGARRG